MFFSFKLYAFKMFCTLKNFVQIVFCGIGCHDVLHYGQPRQLSTHSEQTGTVGSERSWGPIPSRTRTVEGPGTIASRNTIMLE